MTFIPLLCNNELNDIHFPDAMSVCEAVSCVVTLLKILVNFSWNIDTFTVLKHKSTWARCTRFKSHQYFLKLDVIATYVNLRYKDFLFIAYFWFSTYVSKKVLMCSFTASMENLNHDQKDTICPISRLCTFPPAHWWLILIHDFSLVIGGKLHSEYLGFSLLAATYYRNISFFLYWRPGWCCRHICSLNIPNNFLYILCFFLYV